MSKTAPMKKADTGLIQPLPRLWDLTVWQEGNPLSALNRLKISYQGGGEFPQTILGNIRTAPPEVTIYAIEDGKVALDEADPTLLHMSFTVTIGGTAYDFTGDLAPGDTHVPLGTIKPRQLTSNRSTRVPIFEDGNWSAQAQGGGDDDDDDRPEHKHQHRHSR